MTQLRLHNLSKRHSEDELPTFRENTYFQDPVLLVDSVTAHSVLDSPYRDETEHEKVHAANQGSPNTTTAAAEPPRPSRDGKKPVRKQKTSCCNSSHETLTEARVTPRI